MEVMDPQPLSNKVWEVCVLKRFKPLSLGKFDGCSDSYEHVASINKQMAIIWASNSLKWKLLFDTFRDETLRGYMGLPIIKN